LYEQYRSETLSRSVLGERGGYDNSLNTPDSVNPEELVTQGVRIKEEQLRREGEPTLSSISGREVGERVS
jgi:cell division control protein 11